MSTKQFACCALHEPVRAKRFHEEVRYRSEIDGLRAIAVIAIVLFHAGVLCPGGYVGVDIFFVISGFLITSLIWKDLETGHFTFVRFWERRARRIIPAFVVVTLSTLLAGWFLLLPVDLQNLGSAAVSQVCFAANIFYWRDSGYFQGSALEKPLLHTWSLSVEEQFYFIVPLLLWSMFRTHFLRSRSAAISILATGFASSLVLSVYGTGHFSSATYYLLPTRAWELLLGALICFLPHFPSLPAHRHTRELLTVIGAVLILIPIFAYTEKTPFPGLAALPPCIGTALVIWTNSRRTNHIPTAVGAALSFRPLVSIGLISYSLYLWHWPLLAFGNYLSPMVLSFHDRAVMLGFGFLLAVLSWNFVEAPFRQKRLGTSIRSMYILTGAGIASTFGCAALCVVTHGFPLRLPLQALDFARAKSDMTFIHELSARDVRERKLVPIGVPNPALKPTVLVWGDSHAMAAMPALDAFLKEKGLTGRAATHSATAPVFDWQADSKFNDGEDAIAFNNSVYAYVRENRIPYVMLIASWCRYTSNLNGDPGLFARSLLTTVQRLSALGVRPYLFLDVPRHSFNVPVALARSYLFHKDIGPFCARPDPENLYDTIDSHVVSEIREIGGIIIDPKPHFLDATGQYYIVPFNGNALYRDEEHLATKGAIAVLLPLLREQLNSLER